MKSNSGPFERASVLVLCAAGLLAGTGAYPAEGDFYDGETITVYIGRGPGSGTDLALRTFIRHWREHIPGRPTMVVRNIPGGGGTRVWNFGYEIADADGYSLLFSPFSGTAEILGLPGLRADFSKMPLIERARIAGALREIGPAVTASRLDPECGQLHRASGPNICFDSLEIPPPARKHSHPRGADPIPTGTVRQA